MLHLNKPSPPSPRRDLRPLVGGPEGGPQRGHLPRPRPPPFEPYYTKVKYQLILFGHPPGPGTRVTLNDSMF
jgi:hypothetical protein